MTSRLDDRRVSKGVASPRLLTAAHSDTCRSWPARWGVPSFGLARPTQDSITEDSAAL
jgi:hypothetical protein